MESKKYTSCDGIDIELSQQKCESFFGFKFSEKEWMKFSNLCEQTKLNPYTFDIYCQKFEDREAQVFIGKYGYLKIAASNPDYDGMEDGIIYAIDGTIQRDKDDNGGFYPGTKGFFLPRGAELLGAWAIGYAKNRRFPKTSTVTLDAYIKRYKNKQTGKVEVAPGPWSTNPAMMINKVAETCAIRELFPMIFAGTYSEEEMERAREEAMAEVEEKPVPVPKVMPTLEEALAHVVKAESKLKGHTLDELVKGTKADPLPWLENLIAVGGEDADFAQVVLDSIKAGTTKIGYKSKAKKE